MAVIKANGETELGRFDLTISGEEKVESIESANKWFKGFALQQINKGEGSLANGYYPEPNTMLQAYAFCRGLFRAEDITVSGDIGSIEYEPGVIY